MADTSDLHIRHWIKNVCWVVCGCILLLLLWGGNYSATAQGVSGALEQSSRSYEQRHPGNPEEVHNQAEQLPQWAEPQFESPGYHTSPPKRAKSMSSNAPVLPPPPDSVPVDGGLSLLAAAGAGYALRKLRKEGEDE